MSLNHQLATSPPVNIKIWEKGRKYFWAYDYDGCPKNGPFKNEQQALNDARHYSTR
jgi:hypothetical protein